MPRRLRAIARRAALGDLELDASRIDYLLHGEPFVPSDPVPFRDREHARRCWKRHRETLLRWWTRGLPREHALPICVFHEPTPRRGLPWGAHFDR